jgi:uncharacterized protein YndB with AHSA1/START domain
LEPPKEKAMKSVKESTAFRPTPENNGRAATTVIAGMLLIPLFISTAGLAVSHRGTTATYRTLEVGVPTIRPTPKDLVVTRVFDAPVESVWKAWSDSDQVKRWWGPTGFSCPVAKMDFREGGTSLVAMRTPEGKDFYNTWTYKKIVRHQRIEFVLDWADKDGNRVDPSSMGLPPEMPKEVRHLITFKSLPEKKTEMTITEFGYTSDQILELSKAGLQQCLDKMAASFVRT